MRVAFVIAAASALFTAQSVDDQALQAARNLGEAGDFRQLVATCSTHLPGFRERLRPGGTVIVDVRVTGPLGDTALAAAEAKRLYKPFELTESLRSWHVTVLATPRAQRSQFVQVQSVALKSTVTYEAIGATSFIPGPPVGGTVDGLARFEGEAARRIVGAGDLQIAVVLPEGERSCDVVTKDLHRIGVVE